jgi:drug/metabolite transporter (DMT)-like permease
MGKMLSYLMRHWRGRHHIAWALFVNGLLGLVAVILAESIVSDSTPLNWSQQVLWANLAVFAAWFLWAGVGIFRSALRALQEPSTWLTKALAVLALIALLGFAYHQAVDLPDTIKGTPRFGAPIRVGSATTSSALGHAAT